MRVLAVRKGKITYPTGDKSFAVMQAFPAAVSVEEADPFLMSDHFGPTQSPGLSPPDSYPVGWHPHAGMDICTYLIRGRGRHADSLGHREEFDAPGLQWASVGSGIEHAEAGGTPAGDFMEGFQLWLNVPADRKFDAPRYGTHSNLPVVDLGGGATARLLAGPLLGEVGPFNTVQHVLMADVDLPPGVHTTIKIPSDMQTVMTYCYKGRALVGSEDTPVPMHQIALLDGADPAGPREVQLKGGEAGSSVMIFAGVRINQPVVWHGSFVLSTEQQIRDVIGAYRSGKFPPVRAPFDYKRLAAFPSDHPARKGGQ